MTAGPASATADGWLNVFRNTAFSGIGTVTVKLHVGDPGAAGTANPSAVTGGQTATFSAPVGTTTRYIALSNTPQFSMTTTEAISHISLWNGATFMWSVQLASVKNVNNGDTLTLTTLNLGVTSVAA